MFDTEPQPINCMLECFNVYDIYKQFSFESGATNQMVSLVEERRDYLLRKDPSTRLLIFAYNKATYSAFTDSDFTTNDACHLKRRD